MILRAVAMAAVLMVPGLAGATTSEDFIEGFTMQGEYRRVADCFMEQLQKRKLQGIRRVDEPLQMRIRISSNVGATKGWELALSPAGTITQVEITGNTKLNHAFPSGAAADLVRSCSGV